MTPLSSGVDLYANFLISFNQNCCLLSCLCLSRSPASFASPLFAAGSLLPHFTLHDKQTKPPRPVDSPTHLTPGYIKASHLNLTPPPRHSLLFHPHSPTPSFQPQSTHNPKASVQHQHKHPASPPWATPGIGDRCSNGPRNRWRRTSTTCSSALSQY